MPRRWHRLRQGRRALRVRRQGLDRHHQRPRSGRPVRAARQGAAGQPVRRSHLAGRHSTAPRHSPAVPIERAYVDKGYRGHNAQNPASRLHLWQKRGVFGVIKRELRRRSAIEPIIGHLKAEGHLGPATSKAARRRCRQRRPLCRRPQLPPHPRLAASSLAPYPGGSHRTHQRPVGPQISFLTDDQIWTRFNPTGDPLTDLSLEVGRRLKYWDAMRYFFHIFDGSKLFPDDAGNNLPSLEYAKQMAEVVADELKKGGEFCRSSSRDRLGRERQKALRVRRFLTDSPVRVTSRAESHYPRERWFAIGIYFQKMVEAVVCNLSQIEPSDIVFAR